MKASKSSAQTIPASKKKQAAVPATQAAPKAEKAIAKTTPSKKLKAAEPKAAKSSAPAKSKPKKTKVSSDIPKAPKTVIKSMAKEETAKVLDSQLAYQGPLFRVLREHIIEPNGKEANRDVIRHNGSVVILAVNSGKRKKDPWVVIERQYRHAAGQYLWELPAGKLDAGETPLEGAQRELGEETGYKAEKWSPLVEYFASPGFLGEAMKVFLAEGLIAGDAHPEEDEHIDFRLVKLSDLLDLVDKGEIIDGKTLTSVLLYARQLGVKRKK
jgi:ADP-ribose pyrophosphatase